MRRKPIDNIVVLLPVEFVFVFVPIVADLSAVRQLGC
jgi:hypothetical protein